MTTTLMYEELKERLRERFPDCQFDETRVEKIQGASYDAMSVKKTGSNLGVCIDRSDLFTSGETEDEMIEKAVEYCSGLIRSLDQPMFDTAAIMDRDRMFSNLILQVIPVKGNEEQLSKTPHKLFGDLAVIYRVLVLGPDGKPDPGTYASFVIRDEALKAYDVSEAVLEEAAFKAAPKNAPYSFRNMEEVLLGLTGGDPESSLYVLTTTPNVFGASAMFYEGVLEECAERLKGSFIIIPSSIEEVLIMKDTGNMSDDQINQMIKDVNENEVAPELRLSDHAYYYDAEKKAFMGIDEYRSGKKTEAGKKPEPGKKPKINW